MQRSEQATRNRLIAVVFSAIIALIVYAAFLPEPIRQVQGAVGDHAVIAVPEALVGAGR